jgi:ribosomal RNA-processing protein 9
VVPLSQYLLDSYEGEFYKGHLLAVTCVSVFPDSLRCVSGSKDCCLIVWDLESGKKIHIIKGFRHDRTQQGHNDEVLTVSVSDDGSFISSAGKDRLIKIWKGDTYELVTSLKGHRDTITGIKFAHNSYTLFSCSLDRSVKVWNIDDKILIDTLHGHYSGVHDIDSFHNERAITCGFDCSVRIWKTTEESQLVYNGHQLSIDCVKIVNADCFLTGGEDGCICVWKTGKKKPFNVYKNAHQGRWITALGVLKKTDIAASGSYDGAIVVYKVSDNTLQPISSIKVNGYVNALEFSKNGKYLVASVGNDYKLGRWTQSQKTKSGIVVVNLNLPLPKLSLN